MDVDARLEALETDNQRLRDEIERLMELVGSTSPDPWPIEMGLTGKEAAMLGALMRREACTKEQLLGALYNIGVDDEPQIKIIDVFICKLRKKLKPFGVTIDTLWGRGYAISAAMKEHVSELRARRAVAA